MAKQSKKTRHGNHVAGHPDLAIDRRNPSLAIKPGLGLHAQRRYRVADPVHSVSTGQDMTPGCRQPRRSGGNTYNRVSINMKITSKLQWFGLSAMFIAGLAACDKQKPAESAGRQIDHGVDSVGQAMEKLGDKIETQGAKTGVVIDDVGITANVKAAIFAEPGLKTLQISVDTV
jgi:hypothetical protein